MLFVGCLSSQQYSSVSQRRICSDSCTCCHTETEAADQTFYLTQAQYADTRLTSPGANHITPDTRRGSHWGVNFFNVSVTYDSSRKKSPWRKWESNSGSSTFTTRPTTRCACVCEREREREKREREREREREQGGPSRCKRKRVKAERSALPSP